MGTTSCNVLMDKLKMTLWKKSKKYFVGIDTCALRY